MTKKIVAVTGEYINREQQQKAEFTEIGIVGVGKNGKEYVMLDPTISLAGVLVKQNALAAKRNEAPSDMIMCSMVDNDSNQGQQQGGYQQPQQGYNNQQPQNPAPQQGYQNPNSGYQQR